MDANEYGRHYSGLKKKQGKPFSTRYPYTTGLAWTLVLAGALLYLGLHWWPTDPWGMTVAWAVLAIAFIRLLCLLEQSCPTGSLHSSLRSDGDKGEVVNTK